MGPHRSLTVLVLGLAAACTASAQAQGGLRWRSGVGEPGLQPGSSVLVPLYADKQATRTLDMRLDAFDDPGPGPLPRRAPGLGVSLVGRAGLAPDIGVYGRLGTTLQRSPGLAGMGNEGSGLSSYGVGLSWDISPRASAVLGWDSYDFRSLAGEREVRATSLGLQWRY